MKNSNSGLQAGNIVGALYHEL